MSSRQEFNPLLSESFLGLITQRTGLKIREQDRKILERAIQSRMKSLHLSAVNSYYNRLAVETQPNSQEWQILLGFLTNPESYFFRDRGQFSLLKRYILPELIKRRQSRKTLRVWSAGCSTGEEVYSLAILLEKLLLDIDRWDLLILGTDINLATLQTAKTGFYGNWSFRTSDTELQKRYFYPSDRGYLLCDRLRQRVQFRYINLIDCADFYYNEPDYFDLIICRNVFIYFTPDATRKTLDIFSRSLAFDGYLLTGHAELYGQDLNAFQSKIFPESILYQKKIDVRDNEIRQNFPVKEQNNPWLGNPQTQFDFLNGQAREGLRQSELNSISDPLKAPSPIRILIDDGTRSSPEWFLQEAETLFLQKEYIAAIANAEYALKLKPNSFDAFYLLAQIYANAGQYPQAVNFCHKALEINIFSVEIYYLLAQIARECGNLTEEKKYYKKIVYLEPNSIAAYHELAYLYHREGDRDRADKMYYIASELERKTKE